MDVHGTGREGTRAGSASVRDVYRIMRIVVVVAVVVSVVSCAGTSTGEPAVKSGAGELRTDLEPLLKRFPVLSGAEQAYWMSGRFGDPRVPGPSVYWIDAVITLPPGRAEELRAGYAPARTSTTPDVVAGLRDRLPPGPFLNGAALDEAFAHGSWRASAYLDERSGQLVLVAAGE